MAHDDQSAVAAIMDVVGAVTGVREAPDYPPDSIGVFPSAVCFVSRAEDVRSASGWMLTTVTYTLELHWERRDMTRVVKAATPYGQDVSNVLWDDPTLAATVHTIKVIRRRFGAMEWAGVATIGWRWELDCTMSENQ